MKQQLQHHLWQTHLDVYMASTWRPMSLALFSFVFLQISSSYEQLSAFVEGSSDDAPSQDIRIQQNGVDADGSVFAAEALQPYGWQLHAPPRRKLLQSPGMLLYSPLSVSYNGKTCILFRARKLAIRYRNHSLVDLTERTFSPDAPVDTKGSFCSKDKATLNLRFGDVEDLRGLSIRSIQHLTICCFLCFSSQIQAFNVHSSKFVAASDCATFFTPAILMGLITSLILLLVLAYALHMVVHLKHIDRYEEHKTTVYFPRSTEAESTEKNNL
ncbi:uncharacterized protein LOC107712951 [Sinocyclocheilus rhinocerous]|uniref:uncharacterized protein LOC107712951 n=1 Tax=Sinocyclocheilus rhinocerous TaxID=307959 RepID=UPI0007B85FF1|nr:PREDICTED: uncharacterized protein LOC107712951 [Sinocyclocheilus rhinocerous]